MLFGELARGRHQSDGSLELVLPAADIRIVSTARPENFREQRDRNRFRHVGDEPGFWGCKMIAMKEQTDRRALELAVWKMSRGGMPDPFIAATLKISQRELAQLKGELLAA